MKNLCKQIKQNSLSVDFLCEKAVLKVESTPSKCVLLSPFWSGFSTFNPPILFLFSIQLPLQSFCWAAPSSFRFTFYYSIYLVSWAENYNIEQSTQMCVSVCMREPNKMLILLFLICLPLRNKSNSIFVFRHVFFSENSVSRKECIF